MARPWHIGIFAAWTVWEYWNWRERQEQRRFHEWMQYQFLEAKEFGVAQEVPYRPLKDDDEDDEAEQAQQAARAASEPIFDIEGIPASSAHYFDASPPSWSPGPLGSSSPSSSSSVSSSVASAIAGLSRLLSAERQAAPAAPPAPASPTGTTTTFALEAKSAEPVAAPQPPVGLYDEEEEAESYAPVSLADAVPLMLSPEEKRALKRRQKAELLDQLREADLDVEAPAREFKSPKEIYARELAVFEPKRYAMMVAHERRRLNAKKRARMAITPRKLVKLNDMHKEGKAQAKAKLGASIKNIGAMMQRARTFDKDAQLAVMAEQQGRERRAGLGYDPARAQVTRRKSPYPKGGAPGAGGKAAPAAAQPMATKDRARVADSARARFMQGGGEAE